MTVRKSSWHTRYPRWLLPIERVDPPVLDRACVVPRVAESGLGTTHAVVGVAGKTPTGKSPMIRALIVLASAISGQATEPRRDMERSIPTTCIG